MKMPLALLLITSALAGQEPQQSSVWEPWRYFVGSWSGHETGKAGTGRGERTCEFILGDRYLFCDNTSRFEPQEKNPKGETHRDWTFFSYDRGRNAFVIRQFNIEGYVNHFVLDREASGPQRWVFVTESSENAPPGLRARLTCRIRGPDEFEETFELAPQGKEFEVYLENFWRRVRGPEGP